MKEHEMIELPTTEDWVRLVREKALLNMQTYDNCAQSILAAYLEILEINNPLLMRSAGAMLGGMTSSLTCGVHTAGMMILGLFLGREDITQGTDGLAPIIRPSQSLIQHLNVKLGSHSCLELTGVDFTDLRQARKFRLTDGPAQCIERVGEGAEVIALFLIDLEKEGKLFRAG